MRREEFAAARQVLEQVMRSGNSDGRERAEARQTLQMLNDYAEQVAQIKAMGGRIQHGGDADAEAAEDARPALRRRGGASADTQAAREEPPPEAFKPRIKRRAGGQQVRGVLTEIKCVGGASVVVHVQAPDKLYKFHADEFNRVELVAYVPDMAGTSLTCGPVKHEMLVILTYRPAAQPHAKYDGEIIAVDLITKDIEVEP
jgi:hypothetical protein